MPFRRLAPLTWENGENNFSIRRGKRMQEINELIANLSELIRKLSELLDKIEYIAVKRAKK